MFETVGEIILKVTRDCNLRCEYCYIKDKDHYSGERMDFKTFKTLIDRIVSDRAKSSRVIPPQNLSIVFHGGEPTLMGVDALRKFAVYAREKINGVSFAMQTNLTKIDDQWLDFFREYNIRPGVSIDGFSEKDNDLRSQGSLFFDKLDLLKKSGVGYGPLMVLTSNNVKNYYKNALKIIKHAGVDSIKANYAENTYVDHFCEPEPTVDSLYEYVFLPTIKHFVSKGVFIESNIRFFLQRYIEAIFFTVDSAIKHRCLSNCMVKFCGGGNNVVEVDLDGNVCFCGRWSDVNELNVLGSYFEEEDFFGLSSFVKALSLQKMKIKEIRKKQCDICYAQDICTYGCLAFGYDKYGKVSIREDLVCEYVKRIKEFFVKNKYSLLYQYVKSKKWEIVAQKDFYYLNIHDLGNGYLPKEINDSNLQWDYLNNKLYLKMKKKLAKHRIEYK